MSLTGERAEIAAALSLVTGVSGFSYRPTAMNAGDAWPLLESLERGPANDYEVTWRIVVVLPKGERDAMDWFDNMYDDIVAGLEQFGYIERIEPGSLATEAGTRDCMILTLKREA